MTFLGAAAAFLLLGSGRAAPAAAASASELLAPVPSSGAASAALVFDSSFSFRNVNGRTILATVHAAQEGQDRPVLLRLWSPEGGRYRLLANREAPSETVEGPTLSPFEATAFRFEVDRSTELFIHVMASHSGTAEDHDDWVWRVRTDNSLEDVEFVRPRDAYRARLKEGEEIEKGETYRFRDGEASFEFYVWYPDDPHCCPTAGKVTGTFAIARRKGSSRFTMAPAAFKREPIPSP